MALDLDSYRAEAEAFLEEIDREWYLHLSGQKPDLDLDRIYGEHGGLFRAGAVAELRELAARPSGDEGRRLRYLLHFALDGLLGRETSAEAAELGRLEATLEVEDGDEPIPYRQVPIAIANEPEPDRRRALEAARDAVMAEHLNPLRLLALERSHDLCRALGWESYAAAYAELSGLDLAGLRDEVAGLLDATAAVYPEVLDPQLEQAGVPPLGKTRRSDLPRFFRATRFDPAFTAERMLPAFAETLRDIGLDLESRPNIHLDTEPRPTKSPRAFCSTPRVPGEVYLVVAPTGGRDDYSALFHEGGHAQHYAGVDPALPFEFRHLGDNSVTESFAFLLERMVYEPAWLRSRLGIAEPAASVAHSRAVKLLFLRRYAAKIGYELELHGPAPRLGEMPALYERTIAEAIRVEWTAAAWLADVDGGFYVACYLRAWALEALWSAELRERFGEEWFARPEAGEWLRSLWRQGQRLGADELAEEVLGRPLGFDALVAELRDGS
jgi:hypothetical protein